MNNAESVSADLATVGIIHRGEFTKSVSGLRDIFAGYLKCSHFREVECRHLHLIPSLLFPKGHDQGVFCLFFLLFPQHTTALLATK
jgi:hypothetical protein